MSGYGRMRGWALVICAVSAAVASAAVSMVNSGVGWLERIAAFAFTSLVRPFSMTPIWGDLAVAAGSAPSYGAPSAHFLRHEAGTSRRAAARGV